MSSSSSDSDSDDLEPIRKIKINIRPKESVAKKDGADIEQIKASIESWRPLGPPPHPSLSRRQSSLSSVSSLSFGTTAAILCNQNAPATSLANNNSASSMSNSIKRSSPSCSSLVNEFNNRSSFSNFMSTTTSRTSSPLTLMGSSTDAVPVAIAIQESIELTVRGQQAAANTSSSSSDIKFETRALGNIKVAFPNAFARSLSERLQLQNNSPTLKLRMHSTENIIRYYASGLIKDLDATETPAIDNTDVTTLDAFGINMNSSTKSNFNSELAREHRDKFSDLFDLNESPTKEGPINSKIIEFDMETLRDHLTKLYEQSPNARYYNVDVLRYQISSYKEFDRCPLQVCAYWKVESNLIKLRIDFKHSNKSGLNLERLREISFTVDLEKFIPADMNVASLSADSLSCIRQSNNNNSSTTLNMNSLFGANDPLDRLLGQSNHQHNTDSHQLSSSNLSTPTTGLGNNVVASSSRDNNNTSSAPFITYEPQANWNSNTKKLIWKFDNLLSYYKTDGYGSLFAKLDFRNHSGVQLNFLEKTKPSPIDTKFMVVDSTLSKISMSVDSAGYRLSLLKREIRSGRYQSEPLVFN